MRNYRQQIGYIRRRDLLLSSLAGFAFHKISDEEFAKLNACEEDSPGGAPYDHYKYPELADGWESIWGNERISVFRRKMGNRNVYEYRCIGSYSDISGEDFIRAQYDVEYRPKWDKNVVGLDILEEDIESGNQVIRWETRYSYFLQPRLYIYARRKYFDQNSKTVHIISKALDESSYPDSVENGSKPSIVRVTDYSSILLVRAHTEIDQNGLDFVLQYHDDQKATLTNKIYEYSVNYIGPKFLNDVHTAARKLAIEKEKLAKDVPANVETDVKKEETVKLAENVPADVETEVRKEETIKCFV